MGYIATSLIKEVVKMPVELLLWIEAVSKISPLLSNILDAVTRLRFRWYVRGGDLDKVKEDLKDLSDKISYTKKIGEVLGEYIQYFDGSHLLFTTCDKLTEMINHYSSDLSNDSSVMYETYWNIVEGAFTNVKEIKGNYVNVILRRVDFLDIKDGEHISAYTNRFNDEYIKAQTYLREKNTEEFKKSIDDMSEQALNLYKIFENSIENMTNGLISM